MDTLLLVALILGAPQDEREEFVSKVAKEAYLGAVKELDRATDILESDPRSAIAAITGVLSNPKISPQKTECRLKIEISSGTYENRTFFPYQLRGKARTILAKRSEAKDAELLLKDALEDFKKSTDAKVRGTAALVTDATDELKRVQIKIAEDAAKKDDPYTRVKRKVDDYTNYSKYRSAMTYLNGADAKDITAEQRQTLVADIEEKCHTDVENQLNKFKTSLVDATVTSLGELSESGFKGAFKVPSDAELTEQSAKSPVLDWSRRHSKTLKAIQAKQGKAEDVLAGAVEALKLEPEDASNENAWFRAMASLAYDLCDNAIRTRTSKAQKQKKADRAKAEEEAAQVHNLWKDFIAKLDKKVQERHADLATWTEGIESSLREFPTELPELASISIDDCFKEDPGPALEGVETKLRGLVTQVDTKGRVAIESRRTLYTKLITAVTLRRLIMGDSESDIVNDLVKYQRPLKEAGGPVDADVQTYGPKVQRVFEKILGS